MEKKSTGEGVDAAAGELSTQPGASDLDSVSTQGRNRGRRWVTGWGQDT